MSFSKVLHSEYLPVPYTGELPSSYVMLSIGLCQTYRLNVCQYVVFIIKLILSYLPVRLTYSLPTSPLAYFFFEVEELTRYCGSQLGLPMGAAGRTIQAASILLPM